MEFLQDTNFWVLISFIIFAGIFLKFGRAGAVAFLDNKIEAIRNELNHAETLRVEAQELLAEYQRKHKDAMKEAEKIISTAKKHAETIRLQAEEDAKRTAERREIQLQDKLARIEQNARHEIESYTAKIAVDAARQILSEKIDGKTDKAIISNTLGSVSKALN